jgi:hypothetical protein
MIRCQQSLKKRDDRRAMTSFACVDVHAISILKLSCKIDLVCAEFTARTFVD